MKPRPRSPQAGRERLVPIHNENTRCATGWCLEVHDLAVSKLVAGREKDLTFITALFRHHLATPELVPARLAGTPLPEPARTLAADRLHRLHSRGG